MELGSEYTCQWKSGGGYLFHFLLSGVHSSISNALPEGSLTPQTDFWGHVQRLPVERGMEELTLPFCSQQKRFPWFTHHLLTERTLWRILRLLSICSAKLVNFNVWLISEQCFFLGKIVALLLLGRK